MLGFYNLITADIPAGRIDEGMLSDQMRMELLIANSLPESKKHFQDNSGDFIDVCSWKGITCDSDQNVTEVKWEGRISKFVAFRFIPPHVKTFSVQNISMTQSKKIRGMIRTATLPQSLITFNVSDNKLRGTVDLRSLPPNMENALFQMNELKGSVDLSALPVSMQSLALQYNQFSGSVVLDALPTTLVFLGLSRNKFSGEIDLSSLPESLSTLFLEKNSFEGQFTFLNREGRIDIDASENNFSGTAVITSNAYVRVTLKKNPVKTAVEENGEAHPFMEDIFGAQ